MQKTKERRTEEYILCSKTKMENKLNQKKQNAKFFDKPITRKYAPQQTEGKFKHFEKPKYNPDKPSYTEYKANQSQNKPKEYPARSFERPQRERMPEITPNIVLPNFVQSAGRMYTVNSNPSVSQFGENLKQINGKECREWDPKRSKLGAAIAKGTRETGLREDSTVLYLGAAHGYTPSYMSDIVAKGKIYALDFAPRVVRDLVYLCEARKNICPMLADANQPETYFSLIGEQVDIVYMDIAQKNQVEIFLKNIRMYLKKDGFGMLALKSRSIDVSKRPEIIYEEARKELEKELMIIQQKNLNPFEKDHCFFVVRRL
jgi:fibrillarin-like pre-rRNA processing protein